MMNANFNLLYFLLVILRVTLTLLPQTGYFHPDEFFQTFEVLAGKVLDIDVNKPWEFNSPFPIRSIFTPYVIIGGGFKLLKTINTITETYLSFSIMTPYYILVIPRLVMCMISFINDFCLFKICKTNNEKFKSKLIILASSFIILTYGTRTFTNTIEMVLYSVLLYYVAESMIFSNIVIKQSDYLNMRYNKAKTAAEKAKFHKLILLLPDFSYRNCFIISTITVVGFFNRPTFIAFAVGPVFFWLYRGIGTKSVVSIDFNFRIILFCLSTIPSLLLMICFDSFFYGYISWGEIGMWDISINNFVVTPLNFIKYNLDSRNLAQHGLHPRYLHILFNIPLLFGVLGFLALYKLLIALRRIQEARFNELPQMKTIKALMVSTCLLAIIILSIIPHQEPRFLIPLLLPFVYLHGNSILREKELSVIEANETNQTNKASSDRKKKKSNVLLKIWIFSNLVCVIFFGFVHQGSVIQVPFHFADKINEPKTHYHFITCYTYNIPFSLFIQKPRKSFSMHKFDDISYRKIHLHELYSADSSSIIKMLINVHNRCLTNQNQSNKTCKTFVFWPSGLESIFLTRVENYTNSKFVKIKKFYPHFSAEALEYLDIYCLQWFPLGNCDKKIRLDTYDFLLKLLEFFSLSVYEVQFVKSVNNTAS